MKYVGWFFVVVMFTFAASCQNNSGSERSGDNTGETKKQTNEIEEQAESEDKPKGGRKPIGDYGITGDIPAGAKVKDALSDGKAVQGAGLNLVVKKVDEVEKLEDVLRTKKALIDSVTNVEKNELADGWALTFVGGDGDGEKDYSVHVYRELGGNKFTCKYTASEKKIQKKALEFCKSLQNQGGEKGNEEDGK